MRPVFPIAQLASGGVALWSAGASVRVQLYQRGLLAQRRLRAKVISIGNIAWGGTGKTPFTIWLAGRLQTAGINVSILTRGYGRTSREKVEVLPPGTSPRNALCDGDEVQLYLRHLEVPIGIASCRYEAGRAVEDQFPVDVHLLDDGFQHMALARDFDLVLVDAGNPWGSRGSFPQLLREGPAALRRADAILLTHCDRARTSKESTAALRELKGAVLRLNMDVPFFSASTRLLGFVDSRGIITTPDTLAGRRAVAFCGLGSPQNFLGMFPADRLHVVEPHELSIAAARVFPDHHRYTRRDLEILEKLARKHEADCLVTTEKDWVNLPENASLQTPIYWAAIEPVLEQEEEFLHGLGERLGMDGKFLQAGTDPAKVATKIGFGGA
ncbi:MAG: tetraacyldisaccharide 4'-kinase [Acidobacteria bacterium]|nr:tetraacyldisaccharide 4'-kinase [Acidobacteriota bacterium]